VTVISIPPAKIFFLYHTRMDGSPARNAMLRCQNFVAAPALSAKRAVTPNLRVPFNRSEVNVRSLIRAMRTSCKASGNPR
jgi:hypothetical protein